MEVVKQHRKRATNDRKVGAFTKGKYKVGCGLVLETSSGWLYSTALSMDSWLWEHHHLIVTSIPAELQANDS